MVRYLIAAVLVCVYVAGSTLVVRSAGVAHRKSLYEANLAPAELARTPPASKEESVATVPRSASKDLTPSRPESANANPVPAPTADTVTKAATKPSPPPLTAAASEKKEPAASPLANAASPRSVTPRAPINPLNNDRFWSQEPLTRIWNVSRLSVDDERRLGADLHELIVHFNPLVEQGPELQRVLNVAEPFRATLQRKDIIYRFFILDSDEVNAFATPGGYVYVSRGLLDFIAEDEDYALQFAIGHEIAHVDHQHALQCLLDPRVTRMAEGTLQKLYMLILPFGYFQKDEAAQEHDADEWVANRMQRFQRTRREILVFLTKLEGYAEKHGFRNGGIKPEPGRGISPLENHYRAQIAAWKRLKHLKEFIAPTPERPK
jgi:Peptidase family M48